MLVGICRMDTDVFMVVIGQDMSLLLAMILGRRRAT